MPVHDPRSFHHDPEASAHYKRTGVEHLHKWHSVLAAYEILRTLASFTRMAWPLQRCCEKLDDSGDIALLKVTQGSIFRHLNDPNPRIREYCAEQFLRFDKAQTIGVGEIRCRHILFMQDIDIEV